MALIRRCMTQRTKTAWRVQELGKFPGFKNALDLGDESGDGFSPFTVRFSDFQEVQEFLADQVAYRLLVTKSSLDVSGRLAPVFDDLIGRLRFLVLFGFPNRHLDRRSIAEVQASSQIFLGDEFDFRSDLRTDSPEHPTLRHLAG